MNIAGYITSNFWNTKSKRFINFAKYFCLFSIVIGVVALLLSLAVLEGYDRTLRSNAIKFTSHITIQPFDRALIDDYPSLIQKINKFSPYIKYTYPIVQVEGLIKYKDKTEGIAIRGVDQNYIQEKINHILVEGNTKLDNQKAILIGRRLAQKLDVKAGDSLYLFLLKTNDLQNINYRAGKFAVAGVFQSQMAQYDDLIVYTNINNLQALLDFSPNTATNIEIITTDISKILDLSNELEKYLGYPYYSLTVYDLHRSVFSWIELQKEPIPIILGLISIIAAFNIITTLLILVLEKIKQIGILRSIGLTRMQIIQIFVVAGLRLSFLGILIGASLSLILSLIQKNFGIIRLNGEIYFLDVLPIEILPEHYLIVISLTLLLSLLATIIPSIIASRIGIVYALRFK